MIALGPLAASGIVHAQENEQAKRPEINVNRSIPSPVTPDEITPPVGNTAFLHQVILGTAVMPLNLQGDAHFSGPLQGIPVSGANPQFLVRIAAPADAAGPWIASGTERFIGDDRK